MRLRRFDSEQHCSDGAKHRKSKGSHETCSGETALVRPIAHFLSGRDGTIRAESSTADFIKPQAGCRLGLLRVALIGLLRGLGGWGAAQLDPAQ